MSYIKSNNIYSGTSLQLKNNTKEITHFMSYIKSNNIYSGPVYN